jgi:hypothetical protein
MYEEERAYLHPLPAKRYENSQVREANVASDLTFRHETTKYSLPLEYVGKTITVRAYAFKIEAWYKGKLVFTHKRPFVQGEHQYIPEHYLPLLSVKHRALGNAAPLKYGVMPRELEQFRKDCKEKDKYAELAEILQMGRTVDQELLLRAVDFANKTGLPDIQKVRSYRVYSEVSGRAQQIKALKERPCGPAIWCLGE